MDRNDQQAIEELFEKLADVERQGPARDRDAEDFIAREIRRQPGAPYYMAQTIIMQQRALEQLQAQLDDRADEGGGGLFGGLFGGGGGRRRRAPERDYGSSVPRHVRGGAPGGGFLAGAAQTAVGVAGGVLLGNALAGLFGGGDAQAAEADAGAEDFSADDGGDFGDIGGDLDI